MQADTLSVQRKLYFTSGFFLLALMVSLYMENYYLLALPVALGAVWAAFYQLELVLMTVIFFTPLSLNLEQMELGGIGVYVPTEPLLVGITLMFFFKLLSGKSIDPAIFRHPVSYVIYAYLAWMTLVSITSELPLVSFKFLASRIWFIIPMYFIGTHLFADARKIRWSFLLYLFPLFGVIMYTVVRHSFFGFDKDSSHWVMEPLFKDHTSYGAVLAMYFPIICGLLLSRKMGTLLRTMLAIGFIILTVGLVLSFTRAAWISVIGAAGILGVMLLKIPLRSAFLLLFLGSGILYGSWDDIQMALEKNKQESSDNLDEHVSSISNVSSDASNLERLNRWNCAWEMFKERPVFGWGPGTYQFVYAPFQRSKDRTIISTNRGDGGNAHSEYLGPLSEQGIPGMLLVIALLTTISSLSFRLFKELKDYEMRVIVASAYLGLMTYFIHGVLNNYLDTDKASVPFWGFIAVLTAADIYHRGSQRSSPGFSKHH